MCLFHHINSLDQGSLAIYYYKKYLSQLKINSLLKYNTKFEKFLKMIFSSLNSKLIY